MIPIKKLERRIRKHTNCNKTKNLVGRKVKNKLFVPHQIFNCIILNIL